MATELTAQRLAVCKDPRRRAAVLEHAVLNGIDFVQYECRVSQLPNPLPKHWLVVSFLKPLPDAPNSDPDDAYGLTSHLERIRVDGGARIVGIKVLAAEVKDSHLEIEVDQAGDFSTYWLSLGWVQEADGAWLQEIPQLDPQFSRAPVNFKAECPTDFDCRQEVYCPPDKLEEPMLDYLAKDYASFRQLLLDLISQRNPDWIERNPADLGIALVELLAYTGDHLSYFQDAVANEAYLDTARQRVSAKRHARLVDYAVHDGRNAWAYVHLQAGATGEVPAATRILTRIGGILQHKLTAPSTMINDDDLAFDVDPVLKKCQVFETVAPLTAYPQHNTLYIHTFGDRECCLPRGTTSLYLYAVNPANTKYIVRPRLDVGDYLLLEEILGPQTGNLADADSDHRQIVQLESVEPAEDNIYRDRLGAVDGELQLRAEGQHALPLLRVTWRWQEALNFPLCVSARKRSGEWLSPISVARGNIVIADHGRSVDEAISLVHPVVAGQALRIVLQQGPLTMQCRPVNGTARDAQAAIQVTASPGDDQNWHQVPTLLDSPSFAQHFVVDVDNRGRGELRFGDGVFGREPIGATDFQLRYRIGNGRVGNIAAEALAHVVAPVSVVLPPIAAVRNALPASGGIDAETIEQVRQYAPAAFHAEQFRAMTEGDYINAAKKMADVAGAMAAFRWTGSWYTVLLAVDPRNPEDLITEPGGRTRLTPDFEQRVHAFITRYRLAGYDVEIRSARYVPLAIDVDICVAPGYFRGDVLQAVTTALNNRTNPDGRRGFFHPDHHTFNQPVYLSQLYAAIEAVEGVDSAGVTRFEVFGQGDNDELGNGIIPIGSWQIARLDNDPNFQENGVLRLSAGGGK